MRASPGQPTQHSLRLARGTFRYLACGATDRPLVLCLHGFPDFAPSFSAMLEALADAGFFAVAPWLRGYAPSTLEGPFDPDTIADDALAIVDALSPGRPAALVGHDWGAVASYAALAKAPERFTRAITMAVPHPVAFLRNVLREPGQLKRSSYMGLFQLPFIARAVVTRNDFAFIEALWRAWSPGFTLPEDQMRALKSCLAASMPAPIAYYRTLAWPPADAIRRVRDARKIRVPVLHLAGATDGCITPSLGRGQERFFAGEFRADIVPGAGHFLHLERPDDVNARVLRWLTREPARA